MNTVLEKFILCGDFENAKAIFDNTDFETFYENLSELAFENGSLANYSFVLGLLLNEESGRLHDLAYILLAMPLCHMEGAYVSALYHARRAAGLTNYQNVGYMENLLFLNIVPDKVVSDEEAKEVAAKILAIDPKNIAAKEAL